jgi:hypothetical protein
MATTSSARLRARRWLRKKPGRSPKTRKRNPEYRLTKKRKQQMRAEIRKALKRGNFAEAQRLRHRMRQPWLPDRPKNPPVEE